MAEEGLGSNSWVVDAAHTRTGKPMLANDPHLGLTVPSVWYFAHLSAPGLNVIGGTLPGVPFVVLGRHDRIAWGFTNTGLDVQDLYIEKLDALGRNYPSPTGWQPLRTRLEHIAVRGGASETVLVRETRRGPLISDVHLAARQLLKPGYAMALQWTALQPGDTTARAARRMAR